ncbi:hypothetical protein GCM10010965_31580 [Caldalkalibacillus thermarum]|uniref:hypothetical protein n=1 Tax=Caldalkalibacillus thermarum TaxID=296745 RepID=UPI001669A465|nr:hypothetical protein [Caldalkalibacillus thermarum]GGK36294.1 hypothetical protein GCM10010965_31580 [Caldalkalibacillus thermarum]
MHIFRRPVLSNEQYRLMTAIEKARANMLHLHKQRVSRPDGTMGQIPVLLAELRYRYLLHQARKKGWSNMWYLD